MRDALRACVVDVARLKRLQVAVIFQMMSRDKRAVRFRKLIHGRDRALFEVRRASMDIRQMIFKTYDAR